jgi:hypothetical protein
VIRVGHRLTKGTIKRLIKDSLLVVPTTIDDVKHDTLYAVNARFGEMSPLTAPYNIVRVDVNTNSGHGKHKKG